MMIPSLEVPHNNVQRRRSLPGLPGLQCENNFSQNLIVNEEKHSNEQNIYLERRRSCYNIGRDRERSNARVKRHRRKPVADYDEYFPASSSNQCTDAEIFDETPRLLLELPSEESSRRPSKCSVRSGSTASFPPIPDAEMDMEDNVSHVGDMHITQIPGTPTPGHWLCPELSHLSQPPPDARPLSRRASHAGNLGQTYKRDPFNHRQGENSELPLGGAQKLDFLNVPRQRNRGTSLPDNISTTELYRLRNFSTSGKKVINRGDSFRSRNNSINSSRSSVDKLHSRPQSPRSSRSGSRRSSRSRTGSPGRTTLRSGNSVSITAAESECPVYRVVMLGGYGVGKSAICSQFLSSDYVNTYESVEDSVEKDVSLSVNGEESRMVFIDHSHGDMKVENLLLTYCPQAVLVVMAVDDLESFQLAEHILVYLTHSGYISDKVVILVANKADLVRNREIKTGAGKKMAMKYGVKYMETSPGINHNIDELLVGIFTQISLRKKQNQKEEKEDSMNKIGNFLGNMLRRARSNGKSCSNLAVI